MGMNVCTFFGHKDCPETVIPIMMALLEDMIIEEGVSVIYVGNQGRVDAYVRCVLSELMDVHSYIYYAVVLPYVPGHTQEYVNYEDTMVPEGVEAVHPKYAITWRNNWMLKRADYVVTHITHQFGGAAQFAEKAHRQGKTVINITGEDYEFLPTRILERMLRNERNNICLLTDDTYNAIHKVLKRRIDRQGV